MNQLLRIQLLVLQLSILMILTGCGLVTSNEERVARAETEIEAGDYRAAMIELKNVLSSEGTNVDARLLLAKVSLGLGDVLAAEKELARASELDAAETDVVPLHLKILMAKGDYTGVLAVLGTDDIVLTEHEQWSYRGEALLALGNARTAEATYKEWIAADPTSIEAAVGLADAVAAQGDATTATASLESVVEKHPENFAAWHSLGVARFQSGDFAGAEAALIEATNTIQPQAHVRRYAVILAALTESQIILRKIEAAHLSLNRLTGVAENAPMTLLLSARLARVEEDYALASRHLQTLLNISPENTQAQLFLANMQMMQGNLAQAESLLQRVVASSPDNLQARKLLAQVQLQQSQPGGAIEALAPLLEEDVGDADLYAILAQANMQQGDTAAAIQRLRAASELAPEDIEIKLNLASAFLAAGEVDAAIEIIRQVPEGVATMFRGERLMMAALTEKGDVSGADAIADRLLAGNRSQASASGAVVEHYLRTDRAQLARQVMRELVNAQPDDLGAKNALAQIEFAEGNTDRAQSLYVSVIEGDENNLVALLGLAQVAERAGESEKVIRLLQQAADNHVRALGPRVLLARAHLRNGNVNDAERNANEIASIGFKNARVGEVVATVFAEAGRMEDALTQFQSAAELDPLSPALQLGMARAYLALDRSVDARQALRKSLELSPAWPPAMTLLILVEVRQGQLVDARNSVDEFRRIHPDNVTAMVLEGEVLSVQQDYAAAARAFRRAVANGAGRPAVLREYQALLKGSLPDSERTLERWLENNPDDTLARSFLAQHYQMGGDSSRAIQEYERVLQVSPEDGNVLNNLAWHYQQQGDLDRAVILAEKARSLDRQSGSYADTLGWIYRDLGQLDKSLELLRDAVRLSPDNGEIQFHYALALSDSGDKLRAREILELLKTSDAQFPSRERADELLRTL